MTADASEELDLYGWPPSVGVSELAVEVAFRPGTQSEWLEVDEHKGTAGSCAYPCQESLEKAR